MILISSEEYKELKAKLGSNMPHVAITNKQKSGNRKKRYIEESGRVVRILKQMRGGSL